MAKIPNDAKKVFEGVLFDVYHWQQELFDGSYETFEALKRKYASLCVIAVVRDKILLLREEQPILGSFTDVPGGRSEEGEKPEDGVLRELEEETGHISSNIILFDEKNPTPKIDWSVYTFIAKNCELKKQKKLDSGEKIETYLVSFDDFLKEVEKPSFRRWMLRDLIFRLKHTPGELEKFKKLLFD